MKRIFSYLLLVVIPLLLINFSSQQSDSTKDTHVINFYGKVTTVDGKTTPIENISISGKYEDIAVFPKPADKDIDPSKNRTRLDLINIRTIIPQVTPGKSPVAYIYKNREYIEIVVVWKNRKKDSYLIDRDKQLFCYESIEAKPKKEIALEAITKLDISGYSCRDGKQVEPSHIEKEKMRELLATLKKESEAITPVETKNKIEKSLEELANILQSIVD